MTCGCVNHTHSWSSVDPQTNPQQLRNPTASTSCTVNLRTTVQPPRTRPRCWRTSTHREGAIAIGVWSPGTCCQGVLLSPDSLPCAHIYSGPHLELPEGSEQFCNRVCILPTYQPTLLISPVTYPITYLHRTSPILVPPQTVICHPSTADLTREILFLTR